MRYTQHSPLCVCLSLSHSLQLEAIPNIKASLPSVKALMAKHDYRPAVELLGEAIEVCHIHILYIP